MALKRVIKTHMQQFEVIEDDYLKERANDIEDLGRRILMHLQETESNTSEKKYPKNTVLVGDAFSPSDLIDVPQSQLKGVVCLRGSQTRTWLF